jgi:hypothetical protein
VIQAGCLALYVIPATSALGAVLLTGHLGGACAIQFRAGATAFNLVFPIIIGALVWAGLAPRDERVRALLRK